MKDTSNIGFSVFWCDKGGHTVSTSGQTVQGTDHSWSPHRDHKHASQSVFSSAYNNFQKEKSYKLVTFQI